MIRQLSLLACAMAAGALAAAAGPAAASDAPAKAGGGAARPLEMNGYWTAVRTPRPKDFNNGGWDGPGPNPPPLTPWALDYVKTYKDNEKKGIVVSGPSQACEPKGMPYNMEHMLPMDFVQRPDELVILIEERSMPRHIYLDGRKHTPDDELLASSNGESIGHWEGKVLVVDTVGIMDSTLLTIDRIPHSEALHIVEHISLSDDGKIMTDAITMMDPKTFTQPWTITMRYGRAPADTRAVEYICTVDDHRLKGFDKR